jgi:hypothetical protein
MYDLDVIGIARAAESDDTGSVCPEPVNFLVRCCSHRVGVMLYVELAFLRKLCVRLHQLVWRHLGYQSLGPRCLRISFSSSAVGPRIPASSLAPFRRRDQGGRR